MEIGIECHTRPIESVYNGIKVGGCPEYIKQHLNFNPSAVYILTLFIVIRVERVEILAVEVILRDT
jgi:hypothetical protein